MDEYHGACRHYRAQYGCNHCWPHNAQCINNTECEKFTLEQLQQGNTFGFPEEYEEQPNHGTIGVSDFVHIIPPPPEFRDNDNFFMDSPSPKQTTMADIHNPAGENNKLTAAEIHTYVHDRETFDPTTDRGDEQFLTEFHTLISAPEPLATLTSHFQILKLKADPLMIAISLTNTSSRDLRQRIFLTVLQILQLTPHTMTIQEENENCPPLVYEIHSTAQMLTVLLETKQNKEEYRTTEFETHIWEGEFIEIIRHHRPAKLRTQLEQMITTEPIATTSTTPASSTNTHTQQSPQPPKKPHLLPRLTTATTYTSSLQSNIPTTHPDTLTPFLNSLMPHLKEIQRRIQHYNTSALQQGSYPISFVKVSALSINTEIELSPS
jgi:hypothetical protein